MKRGISLLLCLVVFALAGCGTAASSDEPESNSTPKETQTAQSESEDTTGSKTEEAGTVPSARPAISGSVDNMQEYERVVISYPIWHGQAPRIISTFLESYDFSGKTILPFCTSHSSGIGSSAENLHGLCSEQTNWTEGRRFEAGTSLETVREWLETYD